MEVSELLNEKYYIFPYYIKNRTKFKDAVMRFENITQYAGEKFDGAIDYNNVANEIIKW